MSATGNQLIYRPEYSVKFAQAEISISVLSYIKNRTFKNYWGQSGTIPQIREFMTVERLGAISKLIDGFGDGDVTITTAINERLSVEDLQRLTSDRTFYSLLVQTGYLTYSQADGRNMYQIYLPNRELHDVWQDFILSKLDRDYELTRISDILTGMPEPENLASEFEKFIDNRLSYYDVTKEDAERVYHAYVFALMAGAGYKCLSNMEAGNGRYDILAMLPRYNTIFEIKRTKSEAKSALQRAAGVALNQIIEKKYYNGLYDETKKTFLLGIGVRGEECAVKGQLK